MLINYLRIAWRNMVRHKHYAIINISGLAVGIAACILLFTVVRYELSYDTFQPQYRNIYHVATRIDGPNGTDYGAGIPFPMYEDLKASFPQVKAAAIYSNYNSQVSVLNSAEDIIPVKKFIEPTGNFFADARIFSLFQYTWLTGSPQVLDEPGTVVITRSRAEKYFGSWQASMGKLLKLDNTALVKVAGVIDNLRKNTDFPTELIASYETLKKFPFVYGYNTNYGNTTSDFQVYMLLPGNISAGNFNKQLQPFSESHFKGHHKAEDKISHFLRPLANIHFDRELGSFGDHVISKATLWTLSLIGVFIILMACINFINLSTAQSVGRSREMGIRKVLGSSRAQLFGQVMGETGLIVFCSLFVAMVIAASCLPLINHVASIPEKLTLFNMPTYAFLIATFLVVTVLAGIYPSMVVSGFKPAVALKNKISAASIGGISLRRGLVITQFAISQALIIGTIVAISQMNYIRNADLGYNQQAIMVLNSNVDSSVNSRQPAFKEKLLTIPGVQAVSFSSDVPSSEMNNSGSFSYDHKPEENFDIFRKFADEDYVKTYGLQLVAGSVYSKSDTARDMMVNETLVRKLGITDPQKILGHEIRIGRGRYGDVWCRVVGVVKDFQTNSMREDIKPMMLTERNTRYYFTGIKLNTPDLGAMQAEIEKVWNQFFPEFVYQPDFMDDRIKNFYNQENQLALLYKIFAGIAIFISCLGLYGLVLFMAAQKTKEVGIRKVLGASVGNIVYLFSKEFTILIAVAFIIAVPAAWYMMSSWLNDFAYRIHMGVWIFALAILSSLTIAWATVGYKAWKAAKANPVKSLRSE